MYYITDILYNDQEGLKILTRRMMLVFGLVAEAFAVTVYQKADFASRTWATRILRWATTIEWTFVVPRIRSLSCNFSSFQQADSMLLT